MNAENFFYLAALLKERSGLIVTQDKCYLLESRLSPVMRRQDLNGLDELVAALRMPGNGALIDEIVDAMTTNETSFFRDKFPFEALRNTILPGLVATRGTQRALRIWSAACSTGQEPFSLAMMLRDHFAHLNDWRVEIVATDLSPSALEKARGGIFSPFEVQRGLPVQLLVRHFDQIDQNWRVKPELRQMIGFRQLNLLGDITALGRFDIILCRNVLIYFDLPTKSGVLDRMTKMLAPDGALLLGGAESVFGVCDGLQEIAGLRGAYGPASPASKNTLRPTTIQPSVPARTAS